MHDGAMPNDRPAPAKPATRLDYGRRIARAIALIAADPARALRLEDLADAAAFSPFHFHRIYREMTGETPAETQARERLSRAAHLLVRDSLPVAVVARSCGFGSAAAFTRAFRTAYGIPPAAYRARGGIGAPHGPTHLDSEIPVTEITIRQESALRLACLDHRGPYTAIGGAFDRLSAWAAARRLLGPGARFIGLYHDDPQSVPEKQLRSTACVTVPPGVEATDGVRILELPATRVAVLVFRGPYAELEGAYRHLYRDWLPVSGEEPADQPCREEYLNDPRGTPPAELLTALMLPLKEQVSI